MRDGEVNYRGKVRGEVDDLRAGRRGQEVEAKQADENENQKAPRAWPEKTVVKADHHADQNAKLSFAVGRELRRVQVAEISPPIRVDGHRHKQEQDEWLQHLRLHREDGIDAES